MGNEHARRINSGDITALPDEAVRAELGLPNSYTPRPRFLERFYTNKIQKKRAERRKQIIDFILTSGDETMTTRMLNYIKYFMIGGFTGILFKSVSDIYGPIQYFPFRKLEEYVQDYKRLNFYPLRYA